jgi:hypothetical protein
MTHKTRRLLFWGLLAFFLILSPLAIFYSQGYRFDFQKWEIIKIGGLSLRVKTGGAKIFINNRFQEESGGFLYAGSFLKLLPKNYEVRIAKEGYYDWKKTLRVEPNLITEAFNIVLFPQNQAAQKILNQPLDFFSFSADRSRFLTASFADFPATSSPHLKIRLFDANAKPLEDFSPLYLKSAKGKSLPFKILKTRWFNSSEDFILKTEIDKTDRWLLGSKIFLPQNKTRQLIFIDDEIKKSFESAQKILSAAKIKLGDLFPHPLNPKELIFQTGGGIYTFNLETKVVNEVNLDGGEIFDSFLVKGVNIWWLDKTGVLRKKDLNVNLIKEVAKISYFLPTLNYEFINWSDTFGIKTAEILYLCNERVGNFVELIQPIALAKFSPDFRKLFYYKNNQATVQYLEEVKIGDVKKTGEEDVIFSEQVKESIWHSTAGHLIFSTENAIKIAELDSRLPRNIVELVKAIPKMIFYNPDNEKIYFLDEDRLLKIVSSK